MNRLRNWLLNKKSTNTFQQTNQDTLLLQGDPTAHAEIEVFERIEEYKAILEHQAQLSTRRQHANDVYIGLNTIFLTALGAFLLQSHLDTWWVLAVVCAITIIVQPVNITWWKALHLYERNIADHFEYLREIEQEFWMRRNNAVKQSSEVGLFLKRKKASQPQKSNTQLEMWLAFYFVCLYPVIALIVGILIYSIKAHIIPPLNII